VVLLARHAHRQVDAGEGFAVARQRARDHDQLRRRAAFVSFRILERGADERPLDGAILVREHLLVLDRRQQTGRAQGVAIDFDDAIGIDRRRGLRRRRRPQLAARDHLADDYGGRGSGGALGAIARLDLLQRSFY
jgi:hypothetical protein